MVLHRVIRNKCAHGKSGKIEYYHIESLWNFIQENFYKFVVNGGKTGVMQQIEDYYDRTITPLGTDIQPIVNNIKFGVQDAELDDLLKIQSDVSIKFFHLQHLGCFMMK